MQSVSVMARLTHVIQKMANVTVAQGVSLDVIAISKSWLAHAAFFSLASYA